jgi:superfamily II DNA or RNA helicase
VQHGAITAAHLHWIPGHTYARAAEYLRSGRVLSCVADGDSLTGIVTGTATYHVRVSARGGQLAAACSCPVQSEICKHAVALVMHYLRHELPEPPAIEGAFATRQEMDSWAAEHRVQYALAVAADTLCAELELNANDYWMRNVLGRMAIRDVGALELAARHARARNLDVALAQAAYRALHAAAEVVCDGIAEEQLRPASVADPGIAPLWVVLMALRRTLRGFAVPRSRAARAPGALVFDGGQRALTWKERERVARPRDYGTFALATRLTIPGGTEPRLECTCGAPDARCTHSIALVDAALDMLAAGTQEARMIADKLLQPSWARALEELDQLEAKATQPRVAIEVWWHVEDELGEVTLTPTVKKQTRRGAMSAGQRMTAARLLDDHRESLAEADLAIAEHLVSWAPASRAAGTYPARAFMALVGHPRVTTDRSDMPIEVKRVQLGFNALASGEHIRIEPAIEGARFSPKLLGSLLRAFSDGQPLFVEDPERPRCLLIDVGDDARQLWHVLDKHGDAFPPESHGKLLERLALLETRLPLVVPHELKGVQLRTETTVVVRLRLLPDVTLELELFTRPAPTAPLFHPGSGPRDVLISRGGTRGYVRRDLGGEAAHARALFAQLPFLAEPDEGPPMCFRIADTDAALRLVTALQSPPAGIEAQWLELRPVVAARLGPEALRVRVERKRDWFGITGDVKFEAGRVELAVLLDAARRQQRFVRVDAERWVELSETLAQRLLAVSDQTYSARDHLELSPGAVPAIRALAEAGANVEAAPAWDELAFKLASSKKLRPKPPATLMATLRDYQTEGHAWLTRIAAWGAGACLADDMGLGKTIQAIAVLLDRAKLGPAFVLAPTSVTYNWVQELQRFAPTLRPVLYTEQTDRAAALAKLGKRDVLIASYGLLVRDAEQLAATKFATLVVDEAQALKNPTTRRARAARTLDAGFRIAMSGTPFENHLGELWSVFAIIFPGLLGSWEQFRDRYAMPIERDHNLDARHALSRVLRPFLLRRTKQEVARELPSRTEIVVPIALSDDEARLYEDARLAAVAQLGREAKPMRDEQRRFQVLAALTRLRLLASHPKLYDAMSTIPSSKLARAIELLEELRSEGHRALVFSQFTSHLALVRAALDNAGFASLYLDGSTPAAQRTKLVERFQSGEGDVFLISLKAGGTGINLTAADYILHLDPWWNPAVEDQATDRAHRIGQLKPVTVYRLISRGTIEEQIVALHRDKRALVAGILEGSDVAARLTTRDLLSLLQEREL